MKDFGITSASQTALLALALASSTILASCMTTQTTGSSFSVPPSPPTSSARTGDAPIGRFVPCAQDPIIKFNAPDPDSSVSESAANVFDTPETISAVRKHNAAHREACDK